MSPMIGTHVFLYLSIRSLGRTNVKSLRLHCREVNIFVDKISELRCFNLLAKRPHPLQKSRPAASAGADPSQWAPGTTFGIDTGLGQNSSDFQPHLHQ